MPGLSKGRRCTCTLDTIEARPWLSPSSPVATGLAGAGSARANKRTAPAPTGAARRGPAGAPEEQRLQECGPGVEGWTRAEEASHPAAAVVQGSKKSAALLESRPFLLHRPAIASSWPGVRGKRQLPQAHSTAASSRVPGGRLVSGPAPQAVTHKASAATAQRCQGARQCMQGWPGQ